MLCFANLRGQPEPALLQSTSPSRLSPPPFSGDSSPVSPLFVPYNNMSQIFRSCSPATFDILRDMHVVTQTFLARWKYASDRQPTSHGQVAICDAQLQQIYSQLLAQPPTEPGHSADWIYESCRLAALIYCGSIVQGTTLADSTTLVLALHEAFMKTDTRACWGSDLNGVFQWVCLVGGAASWSPSANEVLPALAWAKKCFGLNAIRACLSVGFDQADTTIQALRTMLKVRHWMALNARPQVGMR